MISNNNNNKNNIIKRTVKLKVGKDQMYLMDGMICLLIVWVEKAKI